MLSKSRGRVGMKFVVAAFLLIPAIANAAPQKISCQPTKFIRKSDWLPNESHFTFDVDTGAAAAFDPVVNHFLKEPVTAQLARRSAGGVQLKWQIKNVPMTYKINAEGFFTLDRKIKITMKFTVQLAADFKTYSIAGRGGSLGYVKATGVCRPR